MNLQGLRTQTTVHWDDALKADTLVLNGQEEHDAALHRVSRHLNLLRQRLGIDLFASVESDNNFPTGAGIASSASSFAALTVAGVAAAGATLTERELTTLARRGSGSASRSIPAGFVAWYPADTHEESFAESIAPPEHWDLVDVIAIVSQAHKAVGSTEGHASADTSDLQPARVEGAFKRFDICREAVLARDFSTLAEVVEMDSNLMHAVMMTSRPAIFYWQPPTLALMAAVRQLRADGLRVCYTLDAGPNVHCICVRDDAEQVSQALKNISGVVDLKQAGVGGAAWLIS